MYRPYFTITPKVTKALEELGFVFGFFKTVKIPESFRKEYVSKIIAETAHASTAIEGNTLTERQVQELLAGKKVRALEKDIREVENYNKVIGFLVSLQKELHFDISEDLIRKIHEILLNGIDESITGDYRRIRVRAGDYIPPKPSEIPTLMKEFVGWLGSPEPPNLSPILYAGISHYRFVEIHPFVDGNGRTARALTKFVLMKYGYDITSFFSLEAFYNRDRKAYHKALATADENRVGKRADLTYWLEYFVEGMLFEAERAKSDIEALLEKSGIQQEKIWLNENQRKVLKYTREKGSAKAHEYKKLLRLTKDGAFYTVNRLVEMGFLERVGKGKGSYYKVTGTGKRN